MEKKKPGLGFSHSTKGTRNFNINLLKAQQRILRTQKDLKLEHHKRDKERESANITSKGNKTLESIDRKILSISSHPTLSTKLQTLTTSLSSLLTSHLQDLPHRLTSTLTLIQHELASITKTLTASPNLKIEDGHLKAKYDHKLESLRKDFKSKP